MNIIVTGGAGFIGSNFIFHMLKAHPDYRIVCLDCLTYAGNLSTLAPVMDKPNFRFVKDSITDREAVYRLFEEEHPDIVVNFAAESHVDRSIENPEIFLDTNIKGTAVLMDACRKYGITRYHQVSTDEVYGDLPLDRPDLFFTEETPIHTSSPYSSSKAGADLLVLAYHRTYGLPVTISRCSNNYGPYHFPEKLIPLMIANALNDKPLPLLAGSAGVFILAYLFRAQIYSLTVCVAFCVFLFALIVWAARYIQSDAVKSFMAVGAKLTYPIFLVHHWLITRLMDGFSPEWMNRQYVWMMFLIYTGLTLILAYALDKCSNRVLKRFRKK